MRVLLLVGFFSPGFRGGGPIRTIVNLVETLGHEIDFSVLTLNHDLGDSAPYLGVKSDVWQHVGKALVYYASPVDAFKTTYKAIRDFEGDAMHLNSFFSYRFSILPLLIARWFKPSLPVIIGPRGEFSQGALALKSNRKQRYIAFSRFFGLYKHVIWHASTPHEAEDIYRVMGKSIAVRIAIDIAAPVAKVTLSHRLHRSPLRVIFVSRISPMKNLLGAIEVLRLAACPVHFHVYGPDEDQAYWSECQRVAASLPSHVSLVYKGSLQPDDVAPTLATYDLFFLPTLGENFGHVIAEALFSGLPVLISDQTPWRDLKAKALGWDLPLGQPEAFARCIELCQSKPADQYDAWRRDIRAWALQNIGNQEAIEQNRQLFMNLKASNEH